ncbi:MAG: TasA family protein [Candidatus Paceibacterota bacterium]|jgi:predicted ribosomally synthesized peptide with SipW-like signal peptide
MNAKILVSLATMLVVGAVATAGTVAYFTDTTVASGSTITAGTLDLKVDSNPSGGAQVWSDGFVSPVQLTNLAPGFTDEQIVDIQKQGSVNGVASIRLVVTSNAENTALAPEVAAGDSASDTTGELPQNIRIKISYSPENNGVFGSVLYDYTLAEFNANPNQLVLGDILGTDKTASVKIQYSIPASVGNVIMNDSVTINTIFGLDQKI